MKGINKPELIGACPSRLSDIRLSGGRECGAKTGIGISGLLEFSEIENLDRIPPGLLRYVGLLNCEIIC